MKVLERGIDLNANPIINTSFLWSMHKYNSAKYGVLTTALSDKQQIDIRQYWRKYTNIKDLYWTQFYFQHTGKFDLKYIPHDIYYAVIDRYLNPPHKAVGLDDKRLYHLVFPDVIHPRNLVNKSRPLLLDNIGNPMSFDEAVDACKSAGRVFCKEPVFSCGGQGCILLTFPKDIKKLKELLHNDTKDYLFQECIIQHRDLEVFHPKSINTIRMMTYLRENGEVVILSTVLRMGDNNSFVDNVSSGGCTCGVKDDGELNATGYSNKNYQINKHPNGETFIGKRIPSFKAVQSKAISLHYSFPFFSILAWDFAIDFEGNPVLIEVNMNNASIDFMQLNNGPLFGKYTDEILSRVYKNNFINL